MNNNNPRLYMTAAEKERLKEIRDKFQVKELSRRRLQPAAAQSDPQSNDREEPAKLSVH